MNLYIKTRIRILKHGLNRQPEMPERAPKNWTQAHATMNHFQDTKKLLGRSCARNVDTGGYEVNHIIPR